MKTKAAVCYQAGKELEIATVDLEGPKFGEVLVEIKASGVCHTDEFTRSGGDPEGLFPVIFGHEGAGVVGESRDLRQRSRQLHARRPAADHDEGEQGAPGILICFRFGALEGQQHSPTS